MTTTSLELHSASQPATANLKDLRRADRRHRHRKIKLRRRFYWGTDLSTCPPCWGMAAKTPALHSGFLSGNPRRYFGERTIQEKRLMQPALHYWRGNFERHDDYVYYP